ncbi:unnamed protein product [Rhizophagus irregularis]|uniref:YCII-related domain-containing protein n=1 Tax=Rhizophagus irregularis TaxID=588596 RepID=A0A2N1MQ86_9GLOM|nr:hypothetical protein RhiirC2_788409 [Rhizophagus irregularis]CAB4387159.1 unnamed protein product [Rhizophagus irregularis]CAB5380179.1 unnamed protein product [Rhizophagus irregularis]
MIFSRQVALFSFDAGWCFGRLYSTKFINKRNFSSNLVGRKQFLLLAKDYKDAEAYSRRLSVREEHLEKAKLAKERGFIIAGGAILENPEPNVVSSGEGKMVGSLFIFEAENEEQIRKEIERDPYVINKVWEKYEISPFKMAIK